MTPRVSVRKARAEEIDWINAQYDRVDFKHSVYDNEYIAIAQSNGERIGLGRLQYIEEGVAELGGIFVDENHRGLGAAHHIVGHLIEHSGEFRTIYCIPFVHLADFYRQFGFEEENNTNEAPAEVVDKHHWCDPTYASKTLLLVMKKPR